MEPMTNPVINVPLQFRAIQHSETFSLFCCPLYASRLVRTQHVLEDRVH
jgi:hypothetical protein